MEGESDTRDREGAQGGADTAQRQRGGGGGWER